MCDCHSRVKRGFSVWLFSKSGGGGVVCDCLSRAKRGLVCDCLSRAKTLSVWLSFRSEEGFSVWLFFKNGRGGGIAWRGDSQATCAIILTDSLSLKWRVEWETQTETCHLSTSTFENSGGCTDLDMPEWRETTKLVSLKIWSVEELETLPAGVKPRTSQQWYGGERHGKRKHLMIFLERSR